VSLIVPPFQFAHCTSSLDGTTPTNTPGISFTAGADDADGAAVGVLGALAHDVHFLVIGVGGTSVASGAGNALLDILIDPAGGTSWSSLIDDLCVGMAASLGSAVTFGYWFQFPIWIPAGATVGVRCRTAHTADITTGKVVMTASGSPSRPDAWWCGQKVETLGVDPATSRGTDVTPGNSGAFGSWTSIGAPTTARIGSIQFSVNGTDAAAANERFHSEIGYGSAKLPGSPTFHHMNTVSEICLPGAGFGAPIFCDIAAGTQMQARMTANFTSPETQNCALYGVY
jgi:hypothetical protein